MRIAGANASLVDGRGDTPLHIVLDNGSGKACEQLMVPLLDRGADPDTFNAEGLTALHLAITLAPKGQQQKRLALTLVSLQLHLLFWICTLCFNSCAASSQYKLRLSSPCAPVQPSVAAWRRQAGGECGLCTNGSMPTSWAAQEGCTLCA